MPTYAIAPEDTSTGRGLALLGAGVMGSALLKAILKAGLRDPGEIRITTLDPAAAHSWEEAGVAVAGENAEAVDGASIIVLAVKPAVVQTVLADIADSLYPGALVISVAAGVRLAAIAEQLPQGTAIARVMPNTPALYGEGMAAVSPNEHCTDAQLAGARELLGATGSVVVVPEQQQDAVTALSGSGPAYVFAVAEAMIEGGVLLGLPRPTATELAVQTLYGAATMLRDSGTHPSVLRENVTSPGGTTAAGLRELDRGALRSTILAAMEAAAARSVQLGG